MSRKVVSGIMLTLLLMGMLTLAFNIQPVKSDWAWTETIYIRADGRVDPPTAPISTVDNITYTLTDNIIGDVPEESSAIVVERDDIVVDGAGYTLQGTRAWGSKGADVSGRRNVTIKNMEIKVFHYGIWLSTSSNIVISGNNITNNNDGVSISGSSDNRFYHNNLINNTDQVYSKSSVNIWDDGYPSGGNYWSDYNGTDLYSGPCQNETDHDWIGDSPYIIKITPFPNIDESNQDNYPLMDPYVPETEEARIAYRKLLGKYYRLIANYLELQEDFWNLNATYYDIIADYDGLQADFNWLNFFYNLLNSTYNELRSEQEATKSIMYISIATTIILKYIAITVYFAIRKLKISKK